MALIRHYAHTTGIIILTDSDTAGFRIRRYIKGAVGGGKITNVYIPDIFGKERRKSEPSKEGKLGVEGMDTDVIIKAFEQAGIRLDNEKRSDISSDPITGLDMYELGLSGGNNSSEKRKAVLKAYGLPELLTSGSMTEILNTMTNRTDFIRECEKILGENNTEE